jgi:hypothetical protein
MTRYFVHHTEENICSSCDSKFQLASIRRCVVSRPSSEVTLESRVSLPESRVPRMTGCQRSWLWHLLPNTLYAYGVRATGMSRYAHIVCKSNEKKSDSLDLAVQVPVVGLYEIRVKSSSQWERSHNCHSNREELKQIFDCLFLQTYSEYSRTTYQFTSRKHLLLQYY